MPDDDLAYSSAVELAAAIRQRKISPLDVMRATLARIEKHNPGLNAFVTIPSDAALCAAGKSAESVTRN